MPYGGASEMDAPRDASCNRGLPPVDGTSQLGGSLEVKSLRALVHFQPRRSPYQFKIAGVMAWQAQVSTGLGNEGWGLNREMIGPGDDKGSGRLEISMYNFA